MANLPPDTDVVALQGAIGVLLIAQPSNARLAALRAAFGAFPQAGYPVGLGAWRTAIEDAGTQMRLARLVSQSHLHLQSAASPAESLLATLEVALRQKTLIAVTIARAPLGAEVVVRAPPVPPAPAAAFARMSPVQRVQLLLQRAPAELGPDLARAFRSMVTVEALAGIAAAFVVLLAAQFFGVGEIADAALAWWAYSQAGFSGVYGLYEVLHAVVSAVRATDEAAFDLSVKRFAEGLTLVGVAVLTVVVTRAARKRAGGGDGAAGDTTSPSDRAAPAPAQSRRPIASAPAKAVGPNTYVLGRQWDTHVAKEWPGHSILDIPDWTLAKNDAFVQEIVDQRATVYLASPQTEANLWDAVNDRPTVFGRELDQLKAAGYQQVGDSMYPPPNY